MSPRVSIILPSYNYARFVKERMRSLLAQTYTDYELIIVDDASKDESVALLKSFSQRPEITLIAHEKNSGSIYQRWNEAAAMAKGDWLWFPNADDGASPHFLERMLGLAERHPSAAILYARAMFIDETGRVLSIPPHWYNDAMSTLAADYFSQGYEDLVYHTEYCYLWTASSLLVRRDAHNAVGGIDATLWGSGDWDYYLKLLHRYDLAYTSEPLAYHRLHGVSASTTEKNFISSLANACCLARAYQAMKDDSRYSDKTRATVLKRVKSQIFDMFVAGPVEISAKLRPLAQEVYQVVPDKRLLN